MTSTTSDSSNSHVDYCGIVDSTELWPRSSIEIVSKLREILRRQGRGEEARLEWRQFLDRLPKVHDDWYGYAELWLFLADVAE